MSPEDFINDAIERAETLGIDTLDADQRLVWLITEAEVNCDKDGIESFLCQYPRHLCEARLAFEAVGATEIASCFDRLYTQRSDESLLERLNFLVAARIGYNYDSIVETIGRRLTNTMKPRVSRRSEGF